MLRVLGFGLGFGAWCFGIWLRVWVYGFGIWPRAWDLSFWDLP